MGHSHTLYYRNTSTILTLSHSERSPTMTNTELMKDRYPLATSSGLEIGTKAQMQMANNKRIEEAVKIVAPSPRRDRSRLRFETDHESINFGRCYRNVSLLLIIYCKNLAGLTGAQ